MQPRQTVVALLKASIVGAFVFAIAWVRLPLLLSLRSIVWIFVGYGILIAIFSLVVGFPLARLMERLRVRRLLAYSLAGLVTGASIGAFFTFAPYIKKTDNPFALTFSPWTRHSPGFADGPPYSAGDFWGTVALGAMVGSALASAYWYFSRSRALTARSSGP